MEIADFEGAEGMENQGHTVIVWYFAIINLAAFLIFLGRFRRSDE